MISFSQPHFTVSPLHSHILLIYSPCAHHPRSPDHSTVVLYCSAPYVWKQTNSNIVFLDANRTRTLVPRGGYNSPFPFLLSGPDGSETPFHFFSACPVVHAVCRNIPSRAEPARATPHNLRAPQTGQDNAARDQHTSLLVTSHHEYVFPLVLSVACMLIVS